MSVLAIGNDIEQVIDGCFGLLSLLKSRYTIDVCIIEKNELDIEFNIYEIEEADVTQHMISRMEDLIRRLSPIIVFAPPTKRLRDITLVASRYVKNVLIYSVSNADLVVDISDVYYTKCKILKRSVEPKESFSVYKMILLDRWL